MLFLVFFSRHRRRLRSEVSDAVQKASELLGYTPDCGPSNTPYEQLQALGDQLRSSFDDTRSMATLDGSITLLKRAVSLCPLSANSRDGILHLLAYALSDRYDCNGSLEDLQQCIELNQEALELRPPGHPIRDSTLNNFALALGSRYSRFGDENDLRQCVELGRESLALCPPGHPTRSSSLLGLALALSRRYDRSGEEEDLHQCIEFNREALTLCPPGHPTRDTSLNNLALALSRRYDRSGKEEDLIRCVDLSKEALDLRIPGHPDRDTSLNNLAFALSRRFDHFGKKEDLQQCIDLNRNALALCPPGHPSRYSSLNNLAFALCSRYDLSHEEDDLQRCIELNIEALALCPPRHPYRDYLLFDLAVALSRRYDCFGKGEDLQQCIQLVTEGLALRPPGHPYRHYSLLRLANVLSIRYDRLGKGEDLEKAFSLLNPSSDTNMTEVGALRCALKWVSLAAKFRHGSLGEAYESAIHCLKRYLTIGPTAQLQYEALLREGELASLPTDAAAHFISLGRVDEAIELLDEGRGLLMTEMRRFRDTLSNADCDKIGEDFSKKYRALCKTLHDLSNEKIEVDTFCARHSANPVGNTAVSFDELLKKKRAKRKEYDTLLREIRQLPGCEEFKGRQKFGKLQYAAKDGPVVVVNCSKYRSDMIIITKTSAPTMVPLESDFYDRMNVVYNHYASRMTDLEKKEDTARAISAVLEPVAKKLWEGVVRHAVEALQANGVPRGSRIWWCPTSFLASMPFHAAGYGSDWMIDYYVSSYTTTLSALISARQAATQEPSLPRILVVAQTKTSGLKNAGPELGEMQKSPFFQHHIDEEAATLKSVADHLPAYNWAHFICHGTVSDNPFDSHLHLHNGSKLTLNDIIKLHLKDAKFAFLAACHSAEQSRGQRVLRNEVLHLAAAMQVSGFQSVIGTMWQMEDSDGPNVARTFYTEMLKAECAEESHVGAARALWKTVRWLKDGMPEEKEGNGVNETKKRKKRAKGVPIARWANYIHIGV